MSRGTGKGKAGYTRWLWVCSVALVVITVASLLIFHNQTVLRTQENVRSSMRASAYDQTKLFDTMIGDCLSALSFASEYLVKESPSQNSETREYLQTVCDEGGYYRAWYMDATGTAYSNDDNTIDLSGLACYTSVMAGNSGSSYDASRLNGEWIYMLWAPMIADGNVEGALFVTLNDSGFHNDLVCEAFEEQSYSFVCDSSGKVVIGTENDQGASAGDNFFDLLSSSTFTAGTCEQLSQDLSNVQEGSISYIRDGQSKYALYQPIGINDWTLVSVVNTQVIDDSVNKTMSGFYIFAIIILLVSIGFMMLVMALNRRQKEKLRYDAEHDALTGLMNRDAFSNKAMQMIQKRKSGTYALCCIDIDNFKVVNDRFGHEEGDRLICNIARCLSDATADDDAMVCHGSADTFYILRPNTGERLRRRLLACRERLADYDLPFKVVVRVGIYLVDDPTQDVNTMIDRALLAQRTVKGLADQYIAYYDDAIRQRILREQALVGDMEDALATRQFEVYLQPQYDQNTNAIVSAEALVRWNHPEKGMIPPDQFIPVFESNGFVTRLDAYVWAETFALQRRWLDEGRPCVPLSVNVSHIDMQDDGMCDRIAALFEANGLDPDMIRFEITESASATDIQRSINVVNTLRARGISVEMDDFGKGYSSLNSLKDIPIDVLKLDMRFLSSSGSQGRGQIILGTIMDMARRLDISVIAEGVETHEQADFLKSIGCSTVQGYLFAKPMPASEFEALLGQGEG